MPRRRTHRSRRRHVRIDLPQDAFLGAREGKGQLAPQRPGSGTGDAELDAGHRDALGPAREERQLKAEELVEHEAPLRKRRARPERLEVGVPRRRVRVCERLADGHEVEPPECGFRYCRGDCPAQRLAQTTKLEVFHRSE